MTKSEQEQLDKVYALIDESNRMSGRVLKGLMRLAKSTPSSRAGGLPLPGVRPGTRPSRTEPDALETPDAPIGTPIDVSPSRARVPIGPGSFPIWSVPDPHIQRMLTEGAATRMAARVPRAVTDLRDMLVGELERLRRSGVPTFPDALRQAERELLGDIR